MPEFTFLKRYRVVEVGSADDEVSVLQAYKAIKNIEDEPANMDEKRMAVASGLEVLGPGVKVGITSELQNAWLSFEARTTPKETGTVTTANTAGERLIDSSAQFIANGVEAGALVVNFTDMSVGTVLEVVLETELIHTPLVQGSENDWDIGDNYKVWNIVQCKVSGGNLVAVDGNGDPMSAIHPTAFTQIILTAASSATLSEQEAIQFASYQNGVWVSPTNGQAGTVYPIGTREYPVNNFDDALVIATNVGLNTLYAMENVTCSGHNLDGMRIVGENPHLTIITLSAGCSTEGTEFRDCTLTGILDGDVELTHCIMTGLSGFTGSAHNCPLTGSIALGGTSSDMAQFLNCYLGTAYVGLVEIDMNGDGPHLAMRAFAGGIRIVNKSGVSKVAVDFISGRIEIMDTVTAGTFFLRGVGEITINEATGITMNDAPLINPAKVADAVWDEAIADHLTSGSIGKALKLMLGLAQENFRIKDQVYNGSGNMTSATIRLYIDATDCENDANHIAEYTVIATYDAQNNCTSYKVKRA